MIWHLMAVLFRDRSPRYTGSKNKFGFRFILEIYFETSHVHLLATNLTVAQLNIIYDTQIAMKVNLKQTQLDLSTPVSRPFNQIFLGSSVFFNIVLKQNKKSNKIYWRTVMQVILSEDLFQ